MAAVFHYDPVTCAVALGWPGVTVQELRLQPVLEDGLLRFKASEAGRSIRVVTNIDGDEFSEMWLSTVEARKRDRGP